jgi:hypothetical protein
MLTGLKVPAILGRNGRGGWCDFPEAIEVGQCARIASFAAVIMFRRSLGDTP